MSKTKKGTGKIEYIASQEEIKKRWSMVNCIYL